MRIAIVALLGGVAAVAFGLSVLPADAAPKKRAAVTAQSGVEVSSQRRRVRRAKRPRTRITVRRRSYLDAGTEVLPGERKFTDYAFPPGYDAMQVVTGAGSNAGHQNPWWPLPGRHFPWPP